MALFPVRTNPRWRPPESWIISYGYISTTAHTIHLYSAHRAVNFAIAQLSCLHLWLNQAAFHSRDAMHKRGIYCRKVFEITTRSHLAETYTYRWCI